jgi:hypothetical protein
MEPEIEPGTSNDDVEAPEPGERTGPRIVYDEITGGALLIPEHADSPSKVREPMAVYGAAA